MDSRHIECKAAFAGMLPVGRFLLLQLLRSTWHLGSLTLSPPDPKSPTPRRFDLLEELHRSGPISINALAKLLKRNYKNVHDDVKALAQIGLIEKNDEGRYTVPWDEVTATLRLAA